MTRVAITGGTGFVGGHLAEALSQQGHQVIALARGIDDRPWARHIRNLPGIRVAEIGISDRGGLVKVLEGCDAVAHCAGINREIASQTYRATHIQGTANVVDAAKEAGVGRLAFLSFLRARPGCGSAYHESKWAAEELVRESGLDYTILKAGVIYGRGDHMLDHLSHAFHTFPVFGLVGFQDRLIRPTAVQDIVRILYAALVAGQLSRRTVAVVGPEEMTLRAAVERVASVVGKRPLMFPLPRWFHYGFAWLMERLMATPLVSVAQVRILSEGLVEPLPPCDFAPEELRPKLRFTDSQIRAGLPEPKPFGWKDCR